jgi:hypothetical protein
MRMTAKLLALLIAASAASAAVREQVTPQELASAINKAPLAFVPYRTTKLSPDDVRAVRCIAPYEEPTEFQCKWQHRVKAGWVKRTTWLTIDAEGWRVMDA